MFYGKARVSLEVLDLNFKPSSSQNLFIPKIHVSRRWNHQENRFLRHWIAWRWLD